jgi:large subunit ribosomal protein L24
VRKITRDDLVLVIAGKDRGKQGQVRQVFPRENRLLVQGVNMIKRHMRPRAMGTQAGIIEKEAPIHASNVMIICKSCGKPARVTFRIRPDGVKSRVCRICGEDID